jgi:2'-5' RNA ligase
VRLFLALEPPSALRSALAHALEQVRQHAGAAESAIRWTAPENLHVTLHFIGDVAGERVPDLIEALGPELELAPFALALGHAGTFASRGVLRTVWLGADEGRAGAVRVHEILALRLRDAGVNVERRPFAPHLTLGRARDRDRRRTRGLVPALEHLAIESIAWTVTHVTLFASDLSGPKPVYRPLHTIRLRRPASCGDTAAEGR